MKSVTKETGKRQHFSKKAASGVKGFTATRKPILPIITSSLAIAGVPVALTIALGGYKIAGVITLLLVFLLMLVFGNTAKIQEENRTPKSKMLSHTELLKNVNSYSPPGFLGALGIMGGTTANQWPEPWIQSVAMLSYWTFFAAVVWFGLIFMYRLTGWVGLKDIEGRKKKR